LSNREQGREQCDQNGKGKSAHILEHLVTKNNQSKAETLCCLPAGTGMKKYINGIETRRPTGRAMRTGREAKIGQTDGKKQITAPELCILHPDEIF
jgi:hypothetical protein